MYRYVPAQALCLARGREAGEEVGFGNAEETGARKGSVVLSVDSFTSLAVLRREMLGCWEAKRSECRGQA